MAENSSCSKWLFQEDTPSYLSEDQLSVLLGEYARSLSTSTMATHSDQDEERYAAAVFVTHDLYNPCLKGLEERKITSKTEYYLESCIFLIKEVIRSHIIRYCDFSSELVPVTNIYENPPRLDQDTLEKLLNEARSELSVTGTRSQRSEMCESQYEESTAGNYNESDDAKALKMGE